MLEPLLTVRRLLRAPGELPLIALTLAIGIGGVCAVWIFMYTVLLAPLSFPESDQLVVLWENDEASDLPGRMLSDRAFEMLRSAPWGVESVAIYGPARALLTTSRLPAARHVRGAFVSAELLQVLRSPPALGRALLREDERLTAEPVVVVSERLRDAGIVEGKVNEEVAIDGVVHRVVGVMPATFDFPDRETNFWVPLVSRSSILRSSSGSELSTRHYRSIGRLAPGVSPSAATAQANGLATSSGDRRIVIRTLRKW